MMEFLLIGVIVIYFFVYPRQWEQACADLKARIKTAAKLFKK